MAPITVSVSQPVLGPDGRVYTARYTIANIPANQLQPTITTINSTVTGESSRARPPPAPPANLPTPDPVVIFSETPATLSFTDSYGFLVTQEIKPGSAEHKALFGTQGTNHGTTGQFDMLAAKKKAKAIAWGNGVSNGV